MQDNYDDEIEKTAAAEKAGANVPAVAKADTRGVNVNLSDRRLTKREVAIREGKSERTIDRERKDPKSDFPTPDIINGRCFWWLSKLQAYDRKRARRAPTDPIRQRDDRGRFTKGHDAGEDMF